MNSDTRSTPVLRITDLTKRVTTGDTSLTILADVSFEIERGASVAVLGASGSGKTTLLGLLAGLDTPSEGRVEVDGEDIFRLDEDGRAALRQRLIGFVFQSFQLLPALTALENVMLPLELAGKPDARAQALPMLARVGLGARVSHYPKQLSGGEQQRVALARAFVTNPRVLMADEPTGNLDAVTGNDVIELMFELNREQGTTLVLVTHDEQLARRCGRRLRIAAGRLIADERDASIATSANDVSAMSARRVDSAVRPVHAARDASEPA
ncbi:MAG: ATP-binding cassette domain-containing protein [Proteobacteria bacterium]|nr:ATP-binding cassette domain-containing protein [Burkholderiales bacterium]